ncbi:PRC-barrel domain containing protein [Streptomyces sp. ISL-96]|uniref:PRC-barrel domain containing protein n=1 Tax=Streptomyces sp. ISL-96 TaxID=2819191 RepID=UPI001BE775A3|nr:PRC-barrel domain containing protein [Streptomyces sp. ISL-96]MBT2492725.1 PRC-barrel domain containing protein [Streptomyces sp. ISL-96]
MIQAADIREWRNHDDVDPKQRKIGLLEAIYVDTITDEPAMATITDEPAMATIRTGLLTRQRLVFVPLDDAILGPAYLKVSYAKGLVKKAPSIGTDDVLPAEQEEAIFQHYGLTYQPGAKGERQLARR